MFTHVVVWKVAQPTPERVAELEGLLRRLAGNVPQLRGIEVGVNQVPSGNAHVVLVARFDDADGLAAYRIHPFHQAVAERIAQIPSERLSVDYGDG